MVRSKALDTGSKHSLNPKGDTLNAPRMLTPSEIESLRQNKADITELVRHLLTEDLPPAT